MKRLWIYLVLAVGLTGSLAGAELGYSGFELRAGVLFPSDWDTGYGLGVAVDFGELTQDFRLYGVLTYGQADERLARSCAPLPLEFCPPITTDVSAISVGGEVRWSTSDRWYVGAGVSLLSIDSETTVDFIKTSVDEEQVSLEAVGGVRFGKQWAIEARARDAGPFEDLPLFDGFSLYAVWRF